MATKKAELSKEEVRKILEGVFPVLVNRMSMFVGRPVKLVWDSGIVTASTDCKAVVFMAPWFFLEGQKRVGYGTSTHESGHIRWSPYGTDLLGRANKVGGKTRQEIMNILLDRKDDILTAKEAPGYANDLRERLSYICTMTRRPFIKAKCPNLTEKQITDLLGNWKPDSVWEDFFFAAKWHKHPRLVSTHRLMKYLTSKRLLNASNAELLWIAECIHKSLNEAEHESNSESGQSNQCRQGNQSDQDDQSDQGDQAGQGEKLFQQLCLMATNIERASTDQKVGRILQSIAVNYVAGGRTQGLQKLTKQLQSMQVNMGPISVGEVDAIKQCRVDPDPSFAADNQRILAEIETYVTPLVQTLRRLDSPSTFMLYGQEEGELDFDAIAEIASGSSSVYEEEVIERNVDIEIHLAIDTSGSMYGHKLHQAKQIAKLFCEAIGAMGDGVSGRVWCFDSTSVCDYGPPDPCNGFVAHKSGYGNSDTHMLKIVGPVMARSEHLRKVLLVLCDDGPDNVHEVGKLSQMLLSRGILTVHLLVGVHGTPDIYPIELIYTSMEECLEQSGELLALIVGHTK